MYLNAKLCSFPPQAIKTSEKQRERSSIDRSFVRSPLPAIIIRRHPRVEPLFRGERDRTEGGRKENGEKRRDADLEAFTTTRASPIVILSLSRSPRGRTSDFIGRSAEWHSRIHWPLVGEKSSIGWHPCVQTKTFSSKIIIWIKGDNTGEEYNILNFFWSDNNNKKILLCHDRGKLFCIQIFVNIVIFGIVLLIPFHMNSIFNTRHLPTPSRIQSDINIWKA